MASRPRPGCSSAAWSAPRSRRCAPRAPGQPAPSSRRRARVGDGLVERCEDGGLSTSCSSAPRGASCCSSTPRSEGYRRGWAGRHRSRRPVHGGEHVPSACSLMTTRPPSPSRSTFSVRVMAPRAWRRRRGGASRRQPVEAGRGPRADVGPRALTDLTSMTKPMPGTLPPPGHSLSSRRGLSHCGALSPASRRSSSPTSSPASAASCASSSARAASASTASAAACASATARRYWATLRRWSA